MGATTAYPLRVHYTLKGTGGGHAHIRRNALRLLTPYQVHLTRVTKYALRALFLMQN